MRSEHGPIVLCKWSGYLTEVIAAFSCDCSVDKNVVHDLWVETVAVILCFQPIGWIVPYFRVCIGVTVQHCVGCKELG